MLVVSTVDDVNAHDASLSMKYLQARAMLRLLTSLRHKVLKPELAHILDPGIPPPLYHIDCGGIQARSEHLSLWNTVTNHMHL